MPRVRPGVREVRASERRLARRLSKVDLPTFERPGDRDLDRPGGRQAARVACLGQEHGFTDLGGPGRVFA
jgi:hypothetical protein